MTEDRAGQNYYATAELAAAYDDDCAGRRDLAFYLALAHRLSPRTIVDLGSGTGLLASMLAEAGFEVIAVEPQATMLAIAHRQPHASDVTWVHGSADDVSPRCADLVLMTGHVAQYFLDDAEWRDLLTNVRRVLRPGGHLGFEIRNRALESWRRWATSKPRPTSQGTIEQSVRQTGDLVTHVDEYLLDGTRWSHRRPCDSRTGEVFPTDCARRGTNCRTPGATGTGAPSPNDRPSGSSWRDAETDSGAHLE